MRISKKRLKRIVLEEQYKLLKEWGGGEIETGSPLVDFARAYMGLGNAVVDQLDAVLGAYINGGGPRSENFRETVYEQNPNAIGMAYDRLVRPLQNMENYGDSTDLLDALEEAVAIYMEGEDEVEADARAAGDIL